ncbi:MAG TPA: threonine/serine exporter family protein [Candidatus Nanopelagicales bacterium]
MDDLAEALDLGLEVGELVQLSGGHTARAVDQMERMALALGATEAHPAVSSVNVAMTVLGEGGQRTAGRHAVHLGINFSTLTAVERLVDETESERLTAPQVRARLTLIRHASRVYPVWLVMLALGASSAAFAALFGATPGGIALTFVGGTLGATVRHALVRRHQKPFVAVTAAAFVAALVVAGGIVLAGGTTSTSPPALAAVTLFVVPGVPMLNGTADLLTAHYLNGVVKLAMSAVIIASAAIGLAAAVALSGVLR